MPLALEIGMAIDLRGAAPGQRSDDDVPLGEAAEWTAEASLRLAENWLELKLLEAKHAARAALRSGAFVCAALVMALSAWAAIEVAGAFALARALPADAALACLAAVNLALGGACVALARSRRSGAAAR